MLLPCKRRNGFSGDILAVGSIDDIFERDNIPVAAALRGQRIEVVVDGNEPNAKKRENPFQILAGFQIVSAKARQVLDDDAVNPARADLPHQAFKGRALKICPGFSIVREQAAKLHIALFRDEVRYQPLLYLQRVRARLAAVLHGKTGISGGVIDPLFRDILRRRYDRVELSLCP